MAKRKLSEDEICIKANLQAQMLVTADTLYSITKAMDACQRDVPVRYINILRTLADDLCSTVKESQR